jgi:CHAT domain-containing protein
LPILDAEIALAEAELARLSMRNNTGADLARLRTARTNAHRAIMTLQSHGLVQEVTAGQLTVAALDALLGDTTLAVATYHSLAQHNDRDIQMSANAELGALLPPALALPHLRRAADLAVAQRRRLPMEELQARYSSETSPYHMRLAACLLELGAVGQALESVWAAKAGPLLDLRIVTGMFDSTIGELLEPAKADLARWRGLELDHLRKAHGALQQEQYEYHIRCAQAATAAREVSEQKLSEALRVLGDRGGQAPLPSLTDVQTTLPPDMVVLEYAQLGDDLVCFLIQPRQAPAYRRLGSYKAIVSLLERWKIVCHRLMSDQPFSNAQQQIQSVLAPLWDVLIAPWQEHVAAALHLLVAPWGALHHLPWAALFGGGDYLSDSTLITLVPAGAMWASSIDPPAEPPAGPRLIGYAGGDTRYLKHIAEELDAIAQYLPDAVVIKEAVAADIRRLPPARMLHIAAHALTNTSAPLCSTIELADGPFLLLEAHRLNLHGTELVKLSACETGVRPDHGEMSLALAGAFLCAGAQFVLASLWPVSDSATAVFMDRFYAAVAAGSPFSLALRQAQRHIRTHHPLDWAAFQLWVGAGEYRSSPQPD